MSNMCHCTCKTHNFCRFCFYHDKNAWVCFHNWIIFCAFCKCFARKFRFSNSKKATFLDHRLWIAVLSTAWRLHMENVSKAVLRGWLLEHISRLQSSSKEMTRVECFLPCIFTERYQIRQKLVTIQQHSRNWYEECLKTFLWIVSSQLYFKLRQYSHTLCPLKLFSTNLESRLHQVVKRSLTVGQRMNFKKKLI